MNFVSVCIFLMLLTFFARHCFGNHVHFLFLLIWNILFIVYLTFGWFENFNKYFVVLINFCDCFPFYVRQIVICMTFFCLFFNISMYLYTYICKYFIHQSTSILMSTNWVKSKCDCEKQHAALYARNATARSPPAILLWKLGESIGPYTWFLCWQRVFKWTDVDRVCSSE